MDLKTSDGVLVQRKLNFVNCYLSALMSPIKQDASYLTTHTHTILTL